MDVLDKISTLLEAKKTLLKAKISVNDYFVSLQYRASYQPNLGYDETMTF